MSGRSARSLVPESFRVLPLRRCLAVCGGHALPDGWAEFTEGGWDCQLGGLAGAVFLGLVFLLVVHPLFHPLPGLTHFLCLAKESKQRKARPPKMATHPLNLCNRAETGKTRCAQTVPRLFSARLHKFKAPSRAGTSKAKRQRQRPHPRGIGGFALPRGVAGVRVGGQPVISCRSGGSPCFPAGSACVVPAW